MPIKSLVDEELSPNPMLSPQMATDNGSGCFVSNDFISDLGVVTLDSVGP
jgi:hypothetical protein